MHDLIDNKDKKRFEIEINGETVFADYRLDDKKLFINHVEAPVALRGTGAAGALMQEIKNLAQAEKNEIIPICGYAATWLKRHSKS